MSSLRENTESLRFGSIALKYLWVQKFQDYFDRKFMRKWLIWKSLRSILANRPKPGVTRKIEGRLDENGADWPLEPAPLYNLLLRLQNNFSC